MSVIHGDILGLLAVSMSNSSSWQRLNMVQMVGRGRFDERHEWKLNYGRKIQSLSHYELGV